MLSILSPSEPAPSDSQSSSQTDSSGTFCRPAASVIARSAVSEGHRFAGGTLRSITILCMTFGLATLGLPSVLSANEVTGTSEGAGPATAEQSAPDMDALFFEKHIRPVLKAHCFLCHGEEPELSGNLDLRLVRLMSTGGDSGPAVVPGKVENSLIWQRVSAGEMPPGPKKLTDSERALLADWIRQGARTVRPEPDDPSEARFTEEDLSHWAFQPVVAPAVPEVKFQEKDSASAGLSPIDRFVVQKLEEHGLSLAPAADRATLLRRLSFSLTGLPPTVEELDAFENDHSAAAYQNVVERLLASPQYGVRWARHWLDVAGYAESEGQIVKDRPRPHAWRYRDYVVDALNRDLPYSQFVIEQLAGDQLIDGAPDPDNEEHARLLAATGFLQMAPDLTQTEDTLANRNQTVADTIATVTSSVLGLSVACAQCHDHRYDPVSIEDYYRLRAVFDPSMPIHQWKKPSERLRDMTNHETRTERAKIEAEAVALQDDINARRREHCQGIQDREINAAPEEVREALRIAVNTPSKDQSAEQKSLLERYPKVRTIDWIVGQLVEYDNPAHRRFQEEEKKVAEIRETKPLDRMIMTTGEADAPPASHVFFRGDPQSPAQEVQPGDLSVLIQSRRSRTAKLAVNTTDGCSDEADPDPARSGSLSSESGPNDHANREDTTAVESAIDSGRSISGPKRRLQYARQLTDGSHPLVARVIVNRIWQHHFGQGLVRTPGDFGLNGARPSHPELLDWLADDFVKHGWSLKHLHRRIVTSRVYRQVSGVLSSEAASGNKNKEDSETLRHLMRSRELDPENRWLSRMTLRRLDAESLRDAILSVSGQLNDRLDGPSVPIAENDEGKAVIGTRLLRDGLFAGIRDAGDEARRRSLYLSAHRSLQLNMLQTFDLPAMNPNCQQRSSSTVAPQALLFMNDAWIVEASDAMAARLTGTAESEADRISLAFRLAFGRRSTEVELEQCRQFLEQQSDAFRHDQNAEWQKQLEANPQAAQQRALSSLCQMLMASNRFLYVE